MANSVRQTASQELKDAVDIIEADPHGWWAIHTALSYAARVFDTAAHDFLKVAVDAVAHVNQAGFRAHPDNTRTRFTGKQIMQWQDALYVVNELPEWHFPDDVLLVGWMVECGGPEMGRGPARASFHTGTAQHYVGGTRHLYNGGHHGNGPGWPSSREWSVQECRYMGRGAGFL